MTITNIIDSSGEYCQLLKQLELLQANLNDIPDEKKERRLQVSQQMNACNQQINELKQNVISLAETFARIAVNTERLKAAQFYFERGKFTQAKDLLESDLDDLELTQTALLKQKEKKTFEIQNIDQQLITNANEYLILAHSAVLDSSDKNRYPKAIAYIKKSVQSSLYYENVILYADLLKVTHQPEQAIEWLTKLMKLDLTFIQELVALEALGDMYYKTRDNKQAECTYEKIERLIQSNPTFNETEYLPLRIRAWHMLAHLFDHAGNSERAFHCMNTSIEFCKKGMGTANSEKCKLFFVDVASCFGYLQFDNNLFVEAKNNFDQALSVGHKLIVSGNKSSDFVYSKALIKYAHFCRKYKLPKEEESSLQESYHILKMLFEKDEEQYALDYSIVANNMGLFYWRNEFYFKASVFYKIALQLRRTLAKSNPYGYNSVLATILNNCAQLNIAEHKFDEAKKELDEALAIQRDLIGINKLKPTSLISLYNSFGCFYIAQRKGAEAESYLLASIELARELTLINPIYGNTELAFHLNNCGHLYSKLLLDRNRAIEFANEALRLLQDFDETPYIKDLRENSYKILALSRHLPN